MYHQTTFFLIASVLSAIYSNDGIINKIGEKFYNWDARLKYATLSDVEVDQDGSEDNGFDEEGNQKEDDAATVGDEETIDPASVFNDIDI